MCPRTKAQNEIKAHNLFLEKLDAYGMGLIIIHRSRP